MAYTSNHVTAQIEESIRVKSELMKDADRIFAAGLLASDVLERGGKILLCGNGGSAADAQHIAAELVVRFKGGNERRALPALSLSTDPSTITAAGNDYGYDQIFSRGVEAWGKSGDLLIGISTSGNSKNVILAVEMARKKNMKVLLLLGAGGGKLKDLGDMSIVVPSPITARIQESHIMIGHILCSVIEKKMFNLD